MAWTAALHAVFYRRNQKPWFKQRTSEGTKRVRYERVDGEPKHWDLAECLKRYYVDKQPPERKNLEFMIGLRNKIEHRHLPALDAALYGECQSALMNLEDLLVNEFGSRYGLSESLAVSLQFSRAVPSEKRAATKELAKTSAASVIDYIQKFRGNLPATTLESNRYTFSVYLVPKVAGRKNTADSVVHFIKVDDARPEEVERLRRLNVLIRDKHIPIANLDMMKAGQVVEKVANAIPFVFSMPCHTKAWKHYGVRPGKASTSPHATHAQYCVYDTAHKDYLYTQAWVDRLTSDLSDADGFRRVTGWNPKPSVPVEAT